MHTLLTVVVLKGIHTLASRFPHSVQPIKVVGRYVIYIMFLAFVTGIRRDTLKKISRRILR